MRRSALDGEKRAEGELKENGRRGEARDQGLDELCGTLLSEESGRRAEFRDRGFGELCGALPSEESGKRAGGQRKHGGRTAKGQRKPEHAAKAWSRAARR